LLRGMPNGLRFGVLSIIHYRIFLLSRP